MCRPVSHLSACVHAGVLLVPALLIISQFNSVVAVALSNIAILSSAVANMIFNVPRRSPYRAGPLIDYDLVMLLGPPTGAYVTQQHMTLACCCCHMLL